ncbi:MAG: YbaK/EbsC family protein [Thermodesulfobacteriota bacterium]
MNSSDLQGYIDRNTIQTTIILLKEHTLTVEDAARALNVKTVQIIKSLVFQVNGVPFLVINNGLARVDRKKLAAYIGVGRKKVKFADPDQVLEMTGFVVGSMPPFGHKNRLRTMVDPAVTRQETVYGGGGDINAMMRIAPNALLEATHAEITELSQ